MKALIHLSALLALSALSFSLLASERPDHFSGKKAETLEEAVEHLDEYGDRLEDLLEKEDLSASEMADIHQLTYTLENALQTVKKSLEGTAATLEEVHLASETMDKDTVKNSGQQFLKDIDTLID
ncbi:MAG: DUF6746 family protein [Pseudomonadota bacterium]